MIEHDEYTLVDDEIDILVELFAIVIKDANEQLKDEPVKSIAKWITDNRINGVDFFELSQRYIASKQEVSQ